jgi:hypothetical protein
MKDLHNNIVRRHRGKTGNMKSLKLTGIAFYLLVGAWCIGIVIGMIGGFPYVSRPYAGVTLPCFGGVLLLVLAFCNYFSGSIWRGRARSIDRQTQPQAYWIILLVMVVTGCFLLYTGIHSWMGLS